MTAETFVTDAATRRQVFIQRFAGGEAAKAQALLDRMRAAILERLARDPTDFQSNRLTNLLNDVQSTTAAFMRELNEQTVETVEQFAVSEAEFSRDLLQQTANPQAQLPTDQLLIQTVLESGMGAPVGPSALTIREALDKFAGNKSREILQTIQDAVLLGDTLDQTTRKVGELIDTRQKRQVEALTRTIINHTGNQATEAVMVENAALLDGVKWVATLDSRTTLICGGRDGRIYPPGQGPRPPAHWNCRSKAVPVVKAEFSVPGVTGRRGAVGGKIVDGELVEKRGQVRGDVDYGSWLKRQPAEFQDEVLGPARGKLFREGGLPIDRFRDETGRTYTLDQLKELAPLAFQRAGLE